MKRSLIPMAVVLSVVSLSLNGPSAYGGGRGGGGGGGHGGGWAGGGHGWERWRWWTRLGRRRRQPFWFDACSRRANVHSQRNGHMEWPALGWPQLERQQLEWPALGWRPLEQLEPQWESS